MLPTNRLLRTRRADEAAQIQIELDARTKFLAQKLSIHYNVLYDKIFSRRRERQLVQLRWMICRILRDVGHTFTEIAGVFNRDHSTIVHLLGKTCPEEYQQMFSELQQSNQKWESEHFPQNVKT